MNKSTAAAWKIWGLIAAIMTLVIVSIPWLIPPPVPRHLVIATGGLEGAYYSFAGQMRDILARDGITLEVRSTAGSVENLGLLTDNESGVSLAFIQGGIRSQAGQGQVETLASLYKEPVWVFYRGDETIGQLRQLAGKRIAIGPEGSGTRAIATQVLGENGITPQADTDNADTATRLLPLSGTDAALGLRNGEVDVAFFVISPTAPLVRELLAEPGVRLMDFQRATAYQRRHPFLTTATLPEGMLDLQQNLPTRETVLLAPTANLVARSDLHPALVPILLKAAREIFENGSLLDQPGTFPSASFADFPVRTSAKRYLTSGPTLFYRYLPFGIAAWLDRMKLMLLPICTLMLPLIKAAPPIYRWSIRSKIYRWYRVLREIDQKLKVSGSELDYTQDIDRLRNLEHELSEVSVPLSYMQEFYNLRLHVAFVLGRLTEIQRERTGEAPEPAPEFAKVPDAPGSPTGTRIDSPRKFA